MISLQKYGVLGALGAMYRPLEQQAVLLGTGNSREAAAQFLEFVRYDAVARKIIAESGYGLP